jgi:flavoprotein
MVGEAWMPRSHEIQRRVSKNYREGDITKLFSHDRTEILTFYANIKNSINKAPDKSEQYEIIRERQNDENSRILELKKIENMILNMNT